MILKVENLSKKYEADNNVIENINLTINNGEYVYIIGPNGGGKTTLVKILTNIIKPTSGFFSIATNKVGYLPQIVNAKKDFPISVYEIIATGMDKTTIFLKNNAKKEIDEWLNKMEISHLKKKPISYLSGGELQRVYFIRTVISKPKLLFLDEPMSAIDPGFRKKMAVIIKEYQEKNEATIIHITHDLDEKSSSRVFYIDKTISEVSHV